MSGSNSAWASEIHFDLADLSPPPRAAVPFAEPGLALTDASRQGAVTEAASPAAASPRAAIADPARARLARQVLRMELAYQVLNAIDAAQTIHCLDRDICTEANPLIGRHPTTERIVATKVATGAVHYLVARALLARHPRTARLFETVTLVLQGGVVAWNFHTCF